MKVLVGILSFSICLIAGTEGHGMMIDPVGRSSRWRFNSSAPVNYNDNENYCGGFGNQWDRWFGRCGICGDNYGHPQPRANELGGKYGEGVIVKVYGNVRTARVNMRIMANHLGYVYFDLCDLDKFGKETEKCFLENRLKFIDGSDRYYIGSRKGTIMTTVVLPKGLRCKHCVLRWSYNAGNNWGTCPDGRGALGCGAQENYKACADISIISPNRTG